MTRATRNWPWSLRERRFGKELEQKIEKISRKRQGSKAFKRALKERDQYINRQTKAIDLSGVKAVVVEDLKNVKKDSKKRKRISTTFMNRLQRWVYSYFLDRLALFCEVNGVRVHRVNPVYTSQTCSKCGNRDKGSRNGERFLYCLWLLCGCRLERKSEYLVEVLGAGAYSPCNKLILSRRTKLNL